MKISFIVLTFLVFISCMREEPFPQIKPDEFETVTIYDMEGLSVDSDKIDSEVLNRTIHVTLDLKNTRKIFANTSFHPGKRLWKGSLFAIVQLKNGSECSIAISLYGSFFKVITQPGYFAFEKGSKSDFEILLKDIIENHFVPYRAKRY